MKRQYKSVAYEKKPAGFALLLDGRSALTPLGNPYYIPGEALIKAICEEWRAQGETVRKETMPLTQIASVALDLVAKRRSDLCADLLGYSQTDLICYRAEETPELLGAQQSLDHIVAWAQQRFGITLAITGGIMPVKQPPQNIEKMAAALDAHDNWKLAAIAVAAKPLSSLILALALTEGRIDAQEAFRLAHLEETYETGKWGRDDEKELRLRKLAREIETVAEYLAFL